ncbi:PD-(D/E)XK motif protein [Paraclostridium bifermentans]|uniref:PD-(D/E)XK motif protein n=1 Tax=Paraclostridium bifermentans TaxID=1490 RepID=UPI00374E36FC
MIKSFNPWKFIKNNSQRRVDKNLNYDFFWIVDVEGRYGFYIDSKKIFEDSNENLNLKGITVRKISIDNNYSRLYLILNENDDCEMFATLCQDLINTANKYNKTEKIISEVENRLRQWQRFLKNSNYSSLTVEKQMGLFSELICLKNRIAREIGIKNAITSWVGPDFDKQDFLMDSAVIEVKSYRVTKGEVIYISSLQQLQSPKTPLYLVAYGLTISERGLSVVDIVESIEKQISDDWILDQFKLKLFEYGYIEGVSNKNRLYKFLIDKESIYEVSERFPKIEKKYISTKIISVKYGIDLTECNEFEVDFDSIFEVGGAI